MTLEWSGAVLAATTFATIAIGHVLVRSLNYHFGTKPAAPFFLLGAILFYLSMSTEGDLISAVLGIVAITTVWDGIEIFRQQKRVEKGHAPRKN